jgi:hypothetical protein
VLRLCAQGPSPHNTNLAAKGIVGMAAYAVLMARKGDMVTAQQYQVPW